MCTAITYQTKDTYFGRNLDYEMTFGEQVVLTPRKFPLAHKSDVHYAMLGMAVVADDYPLYFDAINEKGLGMAGLHFVGNAYYEKPDNLSCLRAVRNRASEGEKTDVAPYDLIPRVLSRCKNLEEARELLHRTRVVAIPFNDEFPLSPLHFMIADKSGCIVAEPMKEGLKIYDNPIGVLTNNPPFPFHVANLNNYINLTAQPPVNRFSPKVSLAPFSRGMGAMGLPGDSSSVSRFVRAAFVRANSVSAPEEMESVSQFFHILGSVEQVRGCVCLEKDMYEITTYSCCCNLEKSIYYYRTYEDMNLRKVDLRQLDIDGEALIIPDLHGNV